MLHVVALIWFASSVVMTLLLLAVVGWQAALRRVRPVGSAQRSYAGREAATSVTRTT